MSSIRNDAISMKDIFDLALDPLLGANVPFAPEVAMVGEREEMGPKTAYSIDLSDDCWGLLRTRIPGVALPPFEEGPEVGQDCEWWRPNRETACLPMLVEVNVLGEYDTKRRAITYYENPPVDDCRRRIVEVHERMHAIHHLMEDRHGDIWKDFQKVGSRAIEMLAQMFTHQYFLHRGEISLLHEMHKMAQGQGLQYRMPLEILLARRLNDDDCLRLYWDIREYGELRGGFGAYYRYLDGVLADARSGKPVGSFGRAPNGGRPQDKDAPFFGADCVPGGPGGARPVYLFTYEPAPGERSNVEACLSSLRFYGKPKKADTGIAPGARGFLGDESEIVAVIEVTDTWLRDPARQGEAYLPFQIVERWSPGLPMSVMKKYKSRRLSKPVHTFSNVSDVNMILVAHDAMLLGFEEARADMRELAERKAFEVIRKIFDG